MSAVTLRKELQEYIEVIPENNLYALQPLLSMLAEPLFIIEAADEEEADMIEERMKDFPSGFVSLESILEKYRQETGAAAI
jgi:hypothetical protein